MSAGGPGAPSEELTRSLWERVRGGDAQATQAFLHSYRAALERFARGYLRSREDAEDAVQDVLTKLLGLAQLPDAPRAWIYRVTRNHCLNLARQSARRGAAARADVDELVAHATGPATHGERADEAQAFARKLAGLPELEREALRLRYVEELSRAEIAAVLDVPAASVKTWLFAGLQRLRTRDERHRSSSSL
jgi:RNA polymerase sigma factor (sigma-70 family)